MSLVNSIDLAYNSAPIREHKRLFKAISSAIQNNWRYFETKFFVAKFPPAFCQPLSLFRATGHDFAKQTQFAKMCNKPEPMSGKDL